ncbi:type II toxin-antitoxin system PemK/MazF family toxin [Euhalothece natronophila Z-M001]|uniref:mRNA interferase n=1 Tax=Euhalothece natronophila Z-M001 TaxID=522448 RepID=A0A5B8NR95_9CHRO|nr:type II toxin-antitoxin system PemK/MazF family toxin [Euhalothece natronophila]QDZ41021.1 type II toxin-antitoxin system PemK/MazF family toxin [Euhalothece natronophila Z-M001]
MKRGEIYYAALDPVIGSESAKRCPVLIVSNDINNRVAATVTILPLTSQVSKIYPFEVFLPPEKSGLPKPSKVQAQQIRTISKQRLQGNQIGKLEPSLMQSVDATIKLHLSL